MTGERLESHRKLLERGGFPVLLFLFPLLCRGIEVWSYFCEIEGMAGLPAARGVLFHGTSGIGKRGGPGIGAGVSLLETVGFVGKEDWLAVGGVPLYLRFMMHGSEGREERDCYYPRVLHLYFSVCPRCDGPWFIAGGGIDLEWRVFCVGIEAGYLQMKGIWTQSFKSSLYLGIKVVLLGGWIRLW